MAPGCFGFPFVIPSPAPVRDPDGHGSVRWFVPRSRPCSMTRSVIASQVAVSVKGFERGGEGSPELVSLQRVSGQHDLVAVNLADEEGFDLAAAS